jgi:hypothetical protein
MRWQLVQPEWEFLTPSASAKIVYTPAHVVIGKHTNITRYIDLNHDGINDFALIHRGFRQRNSNLRRHNYCCQS